MKNENPTITGIRKVRMEISQKFGRDSKTLIQHLMELEAKTDHKIFNGQFDQTENRIEKTM